MKGFRILHAAAVAAALGVLATAARAQELPEGVTEAMIKEGATLFSGAGICAACHGPDAKGIPNLGGDLTDQEWVHSDGSFEGIVKSILEGVSADKSTTGTVMPPKGGSQLNESQVKAVAAYVWSLRRKG
ncbi:MAG: c-type cytochrome [Gemmatimonadales bacterium]